MAERKAKTEAPVEENQEAKKRKCSRHFSNESLTLEP